jgi:predicted DNA-binding protein YlxM (UPF0122 family)
MNLLEKNQHYIILYDFYGNLLTDKQQTYFKCYYFEDLSLGEISELYKVSRNAIYDSIQNGGGGLDNFEEKLKLKAKYEKRNKLYQKYYKEETKELIEKLKELE